jgi:glycine dehydrogenase subunit 1
MICELTGMDAANASVYDGASAAAEAAAMCRERRRTKTLISATAHPMVIRTVQTYCEAAGTEVVLVPIKDGKTDSEALESLLDDSCACFYLQQPNYYG